MSTGTDDPDDSNGRWIARLAKPILTSDYSFVNNGQGARIGG